MTLFRASLGFAALVLCAVPLLVYSTPPQAAPPAAVAVTSGDLNLTFTTIDVPGAGVVGAYDINNNGDIVGYYGADSNANKHAFLLSNGVFTYFDYPGKLSTIATGINDSGLITGYTGNLFVQGFLYDGTNFTSVRDGSDTATIPYGINNSGVLVGGAGDPYSTKPFESLAGRFKTLNFPGTYVYGYASGVNNLNQVVGYTDYDAYLYSHGTSIKIDFPGAEITEARSINDNGVIVGWYEGGAPVNIYGFVFMRGKFFSFNYPGATLTGATAINNSGQIVGQYELPDNTWHGFVTNSLTPAH